MVRPRFTASSTLATRALLGALVLSLALLLGRAAAASAAQPAQPPPTRTAQTDLPCGPLSPSLLDWTQSGSPYRLTCDVIVPEGAMLTIHEGVEVIASVTAMLDVRGTIVAAGSPAQPVLFTSAEKAPGNWVGVFISGTADHLNSGSTFDYAIFEYGAYPNGVGNLTLNYASATIRHSTFRNSAKYGLATDLGSFVDISDSTFTGNAFGAIHFRDASPNQKLAGLTIANNGAGNDKNFVLVGGGTITGAVTWPVPAPGVPYVVDGSVDVGSGGALTIAPGVEVQFLSNTHTISAIEDGRLIAEGTAQQPIVFTGVTKTPGSWDGLVFSGTDANPNAGSRLQYVIVEYGGSTGGNIYAEWASPRITDSQIRYSSGYGIYGRYLAGPKVLRTAITGSADYAVYIHQAHSKPEFDAITATGNGGVEDKNAIALGGGTLQGDNAWSNAGVRYDVLGDVLVDFDATLAIAPGVQARFDANRGLDVRGRLLALGAAEQPILFTRVWNNTWWDGIHFEGYADAPSTGSRLDYVTVEYGGANTANISSFWGQLRVTNSIIRRSYRDGVYVTLGGDLVSIEGSQIVDNGTAGINYGVYNGDPDRTVVSARNNWWGHMSGPGFGDDQCPANGSGSRVSRGVDFEPVLTSVSGEANPLAPNSTYVLTLEPKRWFVPADGVMTADIIATLVDGAGQPVPGATVLASTTLGSIQAGGITDATGKTHIFLTSDEAGDADVVAWVDQVTSPCDRVRRATTSITFTPAPVGGPLSPGTGSPYTTGDIAFDPEPVTQGVPLNLQVTLHNPNAYAILVNGILGINQSGIALATGTIREWEGQRIEAGGTLVLKATYTPPVAGHFCFRFAYSFRVAEANRASQDCGWSPGCNWDAVLGKNTDSAPAQTNNDRMREAFGMQTKKVNVRDFEPPTTPPSGDAEKKDINQRINDMFQTTRDIGNSMRSDPPSQDYRTIVQPVPPAVPVYAPGGSANLSAEQAAAINALLRALADAIGYGRAVLGSDDRYAGAAEAGDLAWMTQQAAALLHYKEQTGLAYIRVADALQHWLDVYGGDHIPSVADVRTLQERVRTSGLTPGEIARYRALGCSDASIAWIRQSFLDTDPAEMAISLRTDYADAVQAYRDLGKMLAYPPPTFSQQVSGSAGGWAANPAAARPAAGANLALVYGVERTMEVGNPLETPATVDLKVRRLGLPADWAVDVSPARLALAPGEHKTVRVRISPAGPVVQGAVPSVAVEGYINGSLIGGVEFEVLVPTYAQFQPGRTLYLPLIKR